MESFPEVNQNLIQIFLSQVAKYTSRTALLYKDKQRGRYQSVSWTAWADYVEKTALALNAIGVRKGERVGILSENRPEWTYADLGILSLGAVNVPIYPTSTKQEIEYILKNAGIRILFVSCLSQLEKVTEFIAGKVMLEKIVVFDSLVTYPENTVSHEDFLEQGRREQLNNESRYEELVQAIDVEDVATLIYTSGTTGPPKGVMLTHGNFVSNYQGAREYIQITDRDISLSFLPLSHVFERLAGYYFMMAHGATIAYAENMQTVAEDMMTVRPTVAAAVPRFYEKVYAKINETVKAGPAIRQKIFDWALSVGAHMTQCQQSKRELSLWRKVQFFLARILVFNKIKCGLGGEIRFFISGGAPLSKELAEFFYSAGILILEGYGLTETSPVISVNSEHDFKFGSVGRPLPNVKVQIASDGEILTAGPCVMKGYYKNEEATREVIRDGWFCTGDIGTLDGDGFLKITDRKKDIIVTSGGKNVSPQNIEGAVIQDTLFKQIVVLGDKRNYLVALIYPNDVDIQAYAKTLGINHLRWEDVLKDKRVYQWVDQRLKQRMVDFAPYEQIKYFAFLDRELSQAAGELTPTLKVKRKFVMQKYADLIEKLYRQGAQYNDSSIMAG